MYMYFGTDLIMYAFQMSHAPAAEMDESEFNKHWDVMSTVSMNKYSAFTMFERKALLVRL